MAALGSPPPWWGRVRVRGANGPGRPEDPLTLPSPAGGEGKTRRADRVIEAPFSRKSRPDATAFRPRDRRAPPRTIPCPPRTRMGQSTRLAPNRSLQVLASVDVP